MSDQIREGLETRESKLRKVAGVQVFARRDRDGRPTRVDAIDTDRGRIWHIADRLQGLGYGVMRKRHPRAGKVYYLFKADWAGEDEPPEHPFAEG